MSARAQAEERVGDVVVRRRGRVVEALIDRPKARNAINEGVVTGLQAAVEAAEDAAVLVLRGAGGTFSAGADLEHVAGITGDRAALRDYVSGLSAVLNRLEDGPAVSLAVVEGHAVAGGCELLLACDVVITTTDARIGDRHLEYGLLPGAGGSVRLMRRLPSARARYLLLTGELVTGEQAAEWGLVTLAVPAAQLDETVDRVVERLSRHSPDALKGMKKMLAGAQDLDLGDALRREQVIFLDHMTGSDDVTEGLAAFKQRRTPRFGGSGDREDRDDGRGDGPD